MRGNALSRVPVPHLTRPAKPLRPAVLAGFVLAILAVPVLGAPLDEPGSSAPLSGVLRADGVPLAGVSLVVRGLSGAAASVVRILKTDAEGTFCLPDATPGVYAVLAAVPGFRSASAHVLHRATADGLSFVRLDLDRVRRGVLPAGPGGALDPWIARAVSGGDVLRDEALAEAAPAPVSAPGPIAAASASETTAAAFPFRGSVASLQGFAAEGGGARSQTSLDVRGSLGGGVRWGLSGEYERVMSQSGETLGGASSVALDLLPSAGQSIRVSSRRSEIPSFEAADARLDAHSVDWSASRDNGSRASVSARLLSHRNLEPAALSKALFHREGSALEVDARYRSELGEGRFVRVQLGYRSNVTEGAGAVDPEPDRQARVGGAAGIRLLDAFVVEAGGTGDYSAGSRGIAPELTLSVEALAGLTVYGFASRRFEQREPGARTYGIVGVDDADLVRATRALYRTGVRLERHSTGRLELEASRREISEVFQLLLDTDLVDRVDALYLFPGDVADEVSGSVTFAVRENVAARLALLGGRVQGDGITEGEPRNEARYWVSSARIEVLPSGTSVSVRYRRLEQELGTGAPGYRNERESVDVTLAQEVPIPILRAVGSRWQALFSIAMGSRQEGLADPKQNRQMAGGLSLSF
ncbi:MAG: carboxypeptidase regulatory-like domain-containing protein [Holophagales bacterium]|nr:carboxypeptidase regulatory-like domain-containing protein [Holophagales bacterium]